MEIAPVSGVQLAPRVTRSDTSLALPDIQDVESSSRMGDEIYSPKIARAASGAEEDETDTFENEAEQDDKRPTDATRRRRVSYFV